jgi:hypothetical protein
MYPASFSRLELLPNELIYPITSLLDIRSQVALACVSKAIHPVVEDMLYGSVKIGTTNDEEHRQLVAHFVRTILLRPDLASKVKQVEIYVTDNHSSVDLDNLCEISLSKATLETGTKATLQDADLARIVLTKLPSVKNLFIRFHMRVGGIWSVFPFRSDNIIKDPKSVPAFVNLTTIFWTGLHFLFSFCMSPSTPDAVCGPRLLLQGSD